VTPFSAVKGSDILAKMKKMAATIMLLVVLFIVGQPVLAGPPDKVPMTCIEWYCCFGDSFGETWGCLNWYFERFIGAAF
jgi:hypothetical protein